MIFPFGRELCRRGLRCRAALPTVKAGVAPVFYRNWLTVNVRHRDVGDIVHRTIVKEPAVFPVAALVTDAIIAEAVIHPAIKSDMRPPIPDVKDVNAFFRPPISRSPHQTSLGRHYPGARHPIVATTFAPRPISRYPQITWSRNRRLIVNRQRWRRLIYADAENQLTIGCAQHRQGAWSKEDGQSE
jgi:hypothetical protein